MKLKSKDSDDGLLYWMHIFMYYYKMSYKEFLELPLPTFYELRNELSKQLKAENGKE